LFVGRLQLLAVVMPDGVVDEGWHAWSPSRAR
jgi:hypothetical protein